MGKMKDSGIEWIGEIPKDWKVKKVKHCFYRKNEKAMQENPVILSLARNGVHVRDMSENEGQVAESYYNYNPVDIDDLLINPMDLYSGANCSVSKVMGVISPAYINLRHMDNVNPKFFDYYFKVQYWMMAFFAYGKGVSFENRWTLNVETLMNYPIVVPPYEEQCKRADYLDEKCSQIDETIQKQETIIDKLKEYKLSVINEKVSNTEGNKCHVGYLGQFKNGINFSDTTYGKKYKFLGVGDFKGYFYLDDINEFSEIITNDEISEDYYLKSGDIIFVRSNGSKDLVGRSIMVQNIDFPLLYSGFSIRFRNMRKDIVDNKYLLYFFRCPHYRKQLEKYSRGSNINNVTQDLLSQIELIIPSLDYQNRIVGELEEKCRVIDAIIGNREYMILKLQEYKKSLIYEVVTGKKEI